MIPIRDGRMNFLRNTGDKVKVGYVATMRTYPTFAL